MHAILTHVTIRDERSHQAAVMYYVQGETMETIARHLKVSRSSVSRLLTHAKNTGLIRIEIVETPQARNVMTQTLSEIFNVHATVVSVASVDTAVNRLHSVAQVAASKLSHQMGARKVLGIAWGNTIAEVIRVLPHKPCPDSTVVQLNGSGNANQTGVPYADALISKAAQAFDSTMLHFPVPAFFDYPDTKAALWRERSIKQVLSTISSADIALFGVGSLHGDLPSQVYSGGYLDNSELLAAKYDGVVGDICTVLIREDGSTDMKLNQRASGPSPVTLKRIPQRLCVASGASKAIPLIGALRTGAITDLVIDEYCARAVLDRLDKYLP